jgi:hypothetical protein
MGMNIAEEEEKNLHRVHRGHREEQEGVRCGEHDDAI